MESSGEAGYVHKTHDKPFVMVADLNNPHDICNWIETFREEHEDITPPGKLPELLDNFEIIDKLKDKFDDDTWKRVFKETAKVTGWIRNIIMQICKG
jgi:hypothetical protein